MRSNQTNGSKGGKHVIPLKKALMWIFLSVVAISGSSSAAFLYYRDLRDKQRQDPSFNIVAVAQSASDPMRLSTACLAELLDLSIDRPRNFFCFNVKEAEDKLAQIPVVKQARVKKIPPGIVHVDYALRRPIALLGDYTNTALDAEGITFPIKPFFTPKKLPTIHLGYIEGGDLEGPGWGKALKGRRAELALLIMGLLARDFANPLVNINSVDVSKAYASSCGERQIVVALEELIEELGPGGVQLRSQPRILRLSTDNYQEQLENYKTLQKHLWMVSNIGAETVSDNKLAQTAVVDLRLSNLAFIAEEL